VVGKGEAERGKPKVFQRRQKKKKPTGQGMRKPTLFAGKGMKPGGGQETPENSQTAFTMGGGDRGTSSKVIGRY